MSYVQQVGTDNPEYTAVLTQVIVSLFHQLRDTKLPPPSVREITDWLTHVTEEEVQAADALVTVKKEPRAIVLPFPPSEHPKH
jgi:hypothetical protein